MEIKDLVPGGIYTLHSNSDYVKFLGPNLRLFEHPQKLAPEKVMMRKVGWYKVTMKSFGPSETPKYAHFNGSMSTGYADESYWKTNTPEDSYFNAPDFWHTIKYVGEDPWSSKQAGVYENPKEEDRVIERKEQVATAPGANIQVRGRSAVDRRVLLLRR